MLLGTPDYLAPEQARDASSIDIRADIYSLGCVLYHCLTGQPPFPDTNILSQMVRHATEAPRPLKELAPELPDGLQQIMNWMLAKDPGKRYPTPERAAQALQVFLMAGAEPAKLGEEGPKLKQFLTWVETDGKEKEKKARTQDPATPLPAVVPPREQRGPSTPPPRPAPAPPQAVPAPVSSAKKHHGSKKNKKHKTAAHSTPATGMPVPAPAAQPVRPADFDVELIPAVAPALPAVAAPGGSPKKGLGLSNRDWIMLGVGALGVVAAGVAGFLIANSLR
jgi:eukaryotic-like serine/threonine-protein kinase